MFNISDLALTVTTSEDATTLTAVVVCAEKTGIAGGEDNMHCVPQCKVRFNSITQ